MGIKNGKPVLRNSDIKLLIKTSNMTEGEVKEAFAKFVAENPSGQMDIEQFATHLFRALHAKIEKRGGVADVHQLVDFTTKLESHFFRFYDSNNDGFIDFGEFLMVYYILAEGTQEDILRRMFRIYDQDGNGTICRSEMSKIISDMYDILNLEDPTLEAEDQILEAVYAETDVDNDGKVSIDEFIGACRRQGNLTKLLTKKIVEIFKDSDGEQLLSLSST